MSPRLSCHVRQRRTRSGLSQQRLAERVGVSRQALAAIESGSTTPSTAVALRLADVLQCRVEDLFALPSPGLDVLCGSGQPRGRAVLAQVGACWVAHPLSPHSPVSADALWDATGKLALLQPIDAFTDNVLVAGCAPVLGILCSRAGGKWLHAPSGQSLSWLAEGLVHIAGMHLAPLDAPGQHDALIQSALPGVGVTVFSLVGWRQGFVVAAHNPLGLEQPGDLLRTDLRFVKRQPGSGAAQVLNRVRKGAAHEEEGPAASTHLEAAHAVAFGAADVAVVIEPIARALALPFVPLSEERFELAVRTAHLGHPGVVRVLDQLMGQGFRQEVRSIPGYEAGLAGQRRVIAS